MKALILMGLFVLTSSSCGMSLKSTKRLRGKHAKYWHVCTKEEVKNPYGKLCSRGCVKKKRAKVNCKKTKLTILDLNDPIDHSFAVSKSLTCLDIDQL